MHSTGRQRSVDAAPQTLEHRYVTIDATTNFPNVVALKVELVEYKRCAGDPYGPPDGITNVSDMQAFNWALTNWPGKNTP